MQNFDDEQIADEKSMCNLAGDYAKIRPAYNTKVKIKNVDNTALNNYSVWQLYNKSNNHLYCLAQKVNRQDYKDYFTALAEQNSKELADLVALYPNLNGENTENPLFRSNCNGTVSQIMRCYFLYEFKLINALFDIYLNETDPTNKQTVLNFYKRHLANMETLIQRQ